MADEPLTVRQWTDIVRRARLGRTVKAVALMLATYADADGTRVFPGVARLAVECELGYKAVQAALATLRGAGLITLVRPGRRGRGDADVYRLSIGPDLLEHVELLNPAEVLLAIQKLGESRRGHYRTEVDRPGPLHPSPGGADHDEPPDLHPVADGAGPVDNPDLHPSGDGAERQWELEPAPLGATAETDLHPFSRPTCTPSHDPPPTSTDVTRTTSQPVNGVRTDLAVVGDTGPPQDPDPLSRPTRCPHGLSARDRPDGEPECALCRLGYANVVSIRRRRSA